MNFYIFIIAWLTIGYLSFRLFERKGAGLKVEIFDLFLWPVLWMFFVIGLIACYSVHKRTGLGFMDSLAYLQKKVAARRNARKEHENRLTELKERRERRKSDE